MKIGHPGAAFHPQSRGMSSNAHIRAELALDTRIGAAGECHQIAEKGIDQASLQVETRQDLALHAHFAGSG